jgi:hypothetical protein
LSSCHLVTIFMTVRLTSRIATQSRLRLWLVWARLALLWTALCFGLLQAGLQLRADRAAGWGLAAPVLPDGRSRLPSVPAPAPGITVMLEHMDDAGRRAALQRLADTGFVWVRQRIGWEQAEPEPGRFEWRTSDAMIAAIRDSGLIPVIVLDGSPRWARADRDAANPLAPPQEFAAFARFAAEFAARYGDDVYYYQLWDEPNIAPHWGERHIEPVAYAHLLIAAASAIRQADGDAAILAAALAPTLDRGHTAIDEVYFVQRMLAAGVAPFLDAVAVQPFGFGRAPDDRRDASAALGFQRAAAVRQALVAAGYPQLPVWGVRYGWNRRGDSDWGTVTPQDQACFARSAFEMAHRDWPWLVALGWAIDQPDAPASDPIWGFALTDDVAAALNGWIASAAKSSQRPVAIWPTGPAWLFLTLALCIIGWRAAAAARLLPWSTWHCRYAQAPPWVACAAWGALALVYFFAAWPPLILLCGLAALLLSLMRPAHTLYLAAFLLPFYYQHKELHLAGDTLHVPPSHILLLCLAPLIVYRLYSAPRPLDRWDWMAASWLALVLLTGVNVWYWPAYWRGVVDFAVMPVIGFFAVRLFIRTPGQQTNLAVALFAGGVAAALVGLSSWLAGAGTDADGIRRLVGPHYSPNHTALYLERTFFLGIGLVLATTRVERHFGKRGATLLALAAVALALVLTGSRGALLLALPAGSVILALPVIHAMRRGRSQAAGEGSRQVYCRTLASTFQEAASFLEGSQNVEQSLSARGRWLVPAALVAAVLLLAGPLFGQRLANSATVWERLAIWQTTLRLWGDHLWLGVGPDGYFWNFPAYLAFDSPLNPNLRHPHNVWLEYAVTTGTLGLIWLIVVLACGLYSGLRLRYSLLHSPPWLSLGLVAALVAALAHAQVDAFAALADLAIWNAIALGLMLAMGEISTYTERDR